MSLIGNTVLIIRATYEHSSEQKYAYGPELHFSHISSRLVLGANQPDRQHPGFKEGPPAFYFPTTQPLNFRP